MDTITITVVTILSKYTLDKGAELGQAVGPQALDTAKEMFGMVLARVRKVDPRTADKFPDNPAGYQAPLEDVLQETLAADPDFAAALKAHLEAYKQAKQAHAAQTGQRNAARLEGSGAVSQGSGDALGAGAVQGSGQVGGDVVTGNKHYSEGGMFLGDVKAGGDVAGRDMKKTYTQNPDPAAIASAFSKIYAEVAQKPDLAPRDKADVQQDLQEMEAELKKGEEADESYIQRRLRNIQRMAPDILDVVLTTFANPVLGMGMVAKKVATKMKAEAGSEPEAE